MKVSSRARNLNDMWYVLVYQHVHCCIVACESFLYNNCPESFCCCVHVAMKTVLLITYPYILHHFTFCHFISIQALDFSLGEMVLPSCYLYVLSYNFWLFPLSMPWTNKHQSTCRCGGVRKGLNSSWKKWSLSWRKEDLHVFFGESGLCSGDPFLYEQGKERKKENNFSFKFMIPSQVIWR